MNGASLLARMLRAYDVECLFGVPGDMSVVFYSALREQSLRHVLARDERSAGYMADAYARAANRPGVVEVPGGAGTAYALAAVAEAHASSVPIIVITLDNPQLVEGRGFIAELDCTTLYKSITKESILVKAARKIPETVRRAFRIATSGRPGAVHIAVPEDIMHDEVEPTSVSLHAEAACKSFPAFCPHADPADVQRLAAAIAAARRPLIIAGGGVNRSGAGSALTTFAERYGVPVVTTITGQSAIADRHDLSIGVVGDNGFHPHANRALEESDLLVYVGCRNGSVVSIGWTFPATDRNRKLVQVDVDPTILGNNTDNALSIVSDARLLFEALNALPVAKSAMDADWLPTLSAWRALFWEHAQRELDKWRSSVPLAPQVVIDALNRRLGQDHLLYSDPGTPTPYLCRHLRFNDSKSRLIMQRGIGGLGYALPAVVGGWYACPQTRPIGLFGDGSFGMSAGELETVVRLGIPAILMHFNNSSFAWIKAIQLANGFTEGLSVDFKHQDYVAIARGFGLHAIRAQSAQELEQALDEAFAHPGPVFLDLIVRSIAEDVPPVFRWLRRSGIDPLKVGDRTLSYGKAEYEAPRKRAAAS